MRSHELIQQLRRIQKENKANWSKEDKSAFHIASMSDRNERKDRNERSQSNMEDIRSDGSSESNAYTEKVAALTQIDDFVFLGSQRTATNLKLLLENGIEHILRLYKKGNRYLIEFPDYFTYSIINIKDSENYDIAQHFDECFKIIKDCIDRKERILIHCQGGYSRSPTIVIAYLMKFYGKSLEAAFDYVKRRRDIINPNQGFIRQLSELEMELNEEPINEEASWVLDT